MSLYLETEGTVDLPFDAEETAALVTDAALEYIGCPYEAEVDLLLTHDEEIREMNREHRNIDRPTDVLSFPMLEYETPGDFSGFEDMPDYFDLPGPRKGAGGRIRTFRATRIRVPDCTQYAASVRVRSYGRG